MSLFHLSSAQELSAARAEGFTEGLAAGRGDRTFLATRLILDHAELLIPKQKGDPEGFAKQMEDIAMIINSEQYPSFRHFFLVQIADLHDRAEGQNKDDAHVLNQLAKYLKDIVVSLDQMRKPPEVTEEGMDTFTP